MAAKRLDYLFFLHRIYESFESRTIKVCTHRLQQKHCNPIYYKFKVSSLHQFIDYTVLAVVAMCRL